MFHSLGYTIILFCFQIEAEQRKKVLENLLEEHATLVKQISSSSMEEDNTI